MHPEFDQKSRRLAVHAAVIYIGAHQRIFPVALNIGNHKIQIVVKTKRKALIDV